MSQITVNPLGKQESKALEEKQTCRKVIKR